jgi:hypothetical protein
MLNAPVDSGGFRGPATLTLNGATQSYGLVVLDSLAWGNTWAAQEMSHGFSLTIRGRPTRTQSTEIHSTS